MVKKFINLLILTFFICFLFYNLGKIIGKTFNIFKLLFFKNLFYGFIH